VRALVVPRPKGLGTTHLLRLRLDDSSGRPVSSNLYWLSTREDVLDWKKAEWFYTPTKVHADLTALSRLPATALAVQARSDASGAEGEARVSVANNGSALAFQVHLKLVDAASGEELLPVYWEDNYFALFPGEKRELRVGYPHVAAGRALSVEADAWNAPRVTAEARQ
jgi:exo-1,4-beta-D-glucosaminidase